MPFPEVKGFLETSFIDWKGKVCSVLFLGGCNFRCPFCHNHPLVLSPGKQKAFNFHEILDFLEQKRQWLGGVCVSGGEPSLDPKLPSMLQCLKSRGWQVKLDTNGTRPEILATLLREDLVDMVAMDVKAPLVQHKYDRCAGVQADLKNIRRSISLIQESGKDHEFRMTVVPAFHGKEDVKEWISHFGGRSRLTLQNFNPGSSLDPGLAEKAGFPLHEFEELKKLIPEGNRCAVAA